MENTLFYTFSTISQTAVAGIALVGAFVLYRLQFFDKELEELSNSLWASFVKKLKPDNQFAKDWRTFHLRGNYAGVLEKSQEGNHLLSEGEREDVRPLRLRIKDLLKSKSEILKSFRGALIASSGAIIVSVSALPLVTCISKYPCLAYSLMFLSVGLLVFSVIKITKLVWYASQ